MIISYDAENGYTERKELADLVGYDPSGRALIALWRDLIAMTVKCIRRGRKNS